MSKIYEVRCDVDGSLHGFGAKRTREEAEAYLIEQEARGRHADAANAHHWGKENVPQQRRYWIEEIDTTGLFEIPPRPTPRERYSTRAERISPEFEQTRLRVDVLDGDAFVASYERNYAMLDTFEPFRQGDRHFALISTNYTATSVIDLGTGEVVAAEEVDASGFCPVGFYVPDWWDVHPDADAIGLLPGSTRWEADHEWPCRGDFGFVWGCYWGDDSSWKVQYLDLSRIQKGVLHRDDRFGYVKLATHPRLRGPDFIRIENYEGEHLVEFSILQWYDLDTGRAVEGFGEQATD